MAHNASSHRPEARARLLELSPRFRLEDWVDIRELGLLAAARLRALHAADVFQA